MGERGVGNGERQTNQTRVTPNTHAQGHSFKSDWGHPCLFRIDVDEYIIFGRFPLRIRWPSRADLLFVLLDVAWWLRLKVGGVGILGCGCERRCSD